MQLFAGDRATPLAEPASVLPDRLASYVAGLIGAAPLLIAGDLAEPAAAALGRDRPVSLVPNSAPDALGVAAAALFGAGCGRAGSRRGAAALPSPPGRDAAECETHGSGCRAMSLRIAPLPAGAAEPLSLMHASVLSGGPLGRRFVRARPGALRCLRIYRLARRTFGHENPAHEDPAGFILARDLGGEAEILTLGVLPEMRRLGIGRALLDAVIAQAGRRHIGSVVLEVAADNAAARSLYGRAGFVRVGARPRYYRRDRTAIDALILRLPTGAHQDRAQSNDAER